MTAYIASQASQEDWLAGLLGPDASRGAGPVRPDPAPAPTVPSVSPNLAAAPAEAMFASSLGTPAAPGIVAAPGFMATQPVATAGRPEAFVFSLRLSRRHFLLPFVIGAAAMFCGEFVVQRIFTGQAAKPADTASSSTNTATNTPQTTAADNKPQPPANQPSGGQPQGNVPGQTAQPAQPALGNQQPTAPAQAPAPAQPAANGGANNVYDFLFGGARPGAAQPPAH